MIATSARTDLEGCAPWIRSAAVVGYRDDVTLRPILTSAGIDLSGTLVIRHAFVSEHEDGAPGIQAGSVG